VLRLYRLRFPEPLPPHLTLEQIRGLEGVRVRDTYARWSKETGIPWKGRKYDRGAWQAADAVNRALSAGAACLYGLAHAAIVSLGFSPALGFIHTGKLLSFVYDVADLYKAEYLVPAAFRSAAEGSGSVETRVRKKLREAMRQGRLLERMAEHLLGLFSDLGLPEGGDRVEEDPTRPGTLWDPAGEVEGGVAYGGDDPGERSEGPAG
jgi:CRISPR-associated protein Cas1